jgi:hypothetical protein
MSDEDPSGSVRDHRVAGPRVMGREANTRQWTRQCHCEALQDWVLERRLIGRVFGLGPLRGKSISAASELRNAGSALEGLRSSHHTSVQKRYSDLRTARRRRTLRGPMRCIWHGPQHCSVLLDAG